MKGESKGLSVEEDEWEEERIWFTDEEGEEGKGRDKDSFDFSQLILKIIVLIVPFFIHMNQSQVRKNVYIAQSKEIDTLNELCWSDIYCVNNLMHLSHNNKNSYWSNSFGIKYLVIKEFFLEFKTRIYKVYVGKFINQWLFTSFQNIVSNKFGWTF